jgi:CysZ protein
MFALVRQAASDVLSPPFRGVLFKSLGLTILALVAAWFGLEWLIDTFVTLERGWLDNLVQVISGAGAAGRRGVSWWFRSRRWSPASFWTTLPRWWKPRTIPDEPTGRPLPMLMALKEAVGFTLVVIVVNLGALMLLLVPGINAIIFLIANGYLLGREYFELAALRFRPKAEVKALRRAHGGKVFSGRAGDRRVGGDPHRQPVDAAVCHGADGASAQEPVTQRRFGAFLTPTGSPNGSDGSMEEKKNAEIFQCDGGRSFVCRLGVCPFHQGGNRTGRRGDARRSTDGNLDPL